MEIDSDSVSPERLKMRPETSRKLMERSKIAERLSRNLAMSTNCNYNYNHHPEYPDGGSRKWPDIGQSSRPGGRFSDPLLPVQCRTNY